MLSLTLKYGEVVYLQTKEGIVTLKLGIAGTDRTKLWVDAPKSIGIQREGYMQKATGAK